MFTRVTRALHWFCTLGLCVHYVHSFTFKFNFKQANGSDILDLTQHCKNNDCVAKCCPEKHIIIRQTTTNYTCTKSVELEEKYGVQFPDNYSGISLYNKDIEEKIMKTEKTGNDLKFVYDKDFTKYATYEGKQTNAYLLEDGTWIQYRQGNYWNRWYPVYYPLHFCIDHEVYLYSDGYVSTDPLVVIWHNRDDSANRRAVLTAYGLAVSCVFLLLVLTVYALLPELRNLAGWMLMACTATYFALFFIRIVHVFANELAVLTLRACVTLITLSYYLMLATFCWVNVMSFDMWWTLRNMDACTSMSKLRWYCAYAWGLPVLPTLFFAIVDATDMTHLPGFVKPHLWDTYCDMELEVYFLYFNLPIFILISINIVLFVMTAFNIWQVNRSVSRHGAEENSEKNKFRFWLYLKLSLVMGVSWILEVFSSVVNTESLAWYWYIADFYNSLVGLFIFLTFVCKKKIFYRLRDRFSTDSNLK